MAAIVIVTLQIMPQSPEINLDELREQATREVIAFGGEVGKHEYEPIAFGLKAVKLFFLMPESIGSTEKLEQTIAKLPGVESVNTIDVRRTIG
ncbi:MAG: elongation factor 1-beta [Candidatus Woesearchaeota archaeon]|nr:elongation factor 1-beta [Candidatus Woesearchaeota archaeon]